MLEQRLPQHMTQKVSCTIRKLYYKTCECICLDHFIVCMCSNFKFGLKYKTIEEIETDHLNPKDAVVLKAIVSMDGTSFCTKPSDIDIDFLRQKYEKGNYTPHLKWKINDNIIMYMSHLQFAYQTAIYQMFKTH